MSIPATSPQASFSNVISTFIPLFTLTTDDDTWKREAKRDGIFRIQLRQQYLKLMYWLTEGNIDGLRDTLPALERSLAALDCIATDAGACLCVRLRNNAPSPQPDSRTAVALPVPFIPCSYFNMPHDRCSLCVFM